jgi:hypothetical protein
MDPAFYSTSVLRRTLVHIHKQCRFSATQPALALDATLYLTPAPQRLAKCLLFCSCGPFCVFIPSPASAGPNSFGRFGCI